MKKFLVIFVLMVAVAAATAQTIQTSGNVANQNVPPAYVTPDCTLAGTFTATGDSPTLANADTGCSTWNIQYSVNSATASISIEVDFASEGATLGTAGSFTIWPAAQVGNGALPFTTTTENAATLSGYHPYVKVHIGTLTGAGASGKYRLYGWKGQGSSDVVQSAQSITILPSSAAAIGVTPVVSTAVESGHVLKNAAGNLYGVVVTATVNGLVMVFNSTTVPGDGAVTPLYCTRLTVDSGNSGTAGISFLPGPPAVFSTGISVAFSTGTNCANKTASATAWISGLVK